MEAVLLLLAAVTIFYMIFIGDAPSVQRSPSMVLCGIGVFLFDRDRDYYKHPRHFLRHAVVRQPSRAFQPRFLLSFCATFSLFFLAPPLTERLVRAMNPPEARRSAPFPPRSFSRLRSALASFLSTSLAVSAAVQVYLWPVLLHYFGSFPTSTSPPTSPSSPFRGYRSGSSSSPDRLPVRSSLAIVVAEVNAVVITLILRLTLLFGRVAPSPSEGFRIRHTAYFIGATAAVALLLRRRARKGSPQAWRMGTCRGNGSRRLVDRKRLPSLEAKQLIRSWASGVVLGHTEAQREQRSG